MSKSLLQKTENVSNVTKICQKWLKSCPKSPQIFLIWQKFVKIISPCVYCERNLSEITEVLSEKTQKLSKITPDLSNLAKKIVKNDLKVAECVKKFVPKDSNVCNVGRICQKLQKFCLKWLKIWQTFVHNDSKCVYCGQNLSKKKITENCQI